MAPLEASHGFGRRHGLLHQFAACVCQAGQTLLGFQLAPGHVHVHAHRAAVAQGFLDGGHVGHISGHAAAANLQLEGLVPTQRQHALGFVNVFGGIAGGQCPGHPQAVAHTPAQQLRHGQPGAVAQCIEQGGFHRALGETVFLDGFVEPGHEGRYVVGVCTHEQRREVGVDGQFHALWRFRPVGQPANGGAFAHAHGAVRAVQAHQHERLPVHGGHGQLVWPDRGQVYQEGFHPFNHGRTGWKREAGAVLHGAN